MGFIHTPCSEKYLPSGKRKKRGRCIEPFNEIVLFQISQNGICSKHICHGSLLGCKYLNFTLLYTLSDPLPILSSSQKFVSIFHDMMHESDISRPIPQKILPQWTPISEISSQCLQNLLLSEEMIHRNNESPLPLIWAHLR
ncbi:hypothetical protein IEQ34_023456 [Dendrobium chrysotoxum]|uniref:Ycf2 N-terminal domain-containing protein n=2 Tax=Magnoliopsida TaxID=3398 RepID=A0AAV7FV01_DENCH|nr:hypothetical protein IEQ34_023456 [Dendrobium chrysotoxum]